MQKPELKNRLRRAGKWFLWVLLVQFILINISAALHAYRLTHFYDPKKLEPKPARNIFSKTWKLFTGPRYVKSAVTSTPDFGFQTIYLKTKNDLSIEAWVGKVDSALGTVILFHGITANKSFLLGEAGQFHAMGYNVMLVDLRGHGNSSGNKTTAGVDEGEEVKLAYDYIEKTQGGKIYLYGVSLGAVIIAKAIADYQLQPSGVILEMPFASLHDHLKARARTLGYPQEPYGVLVTFWAGVERGFNGFNHNTCQYVSKLNVPVLMQWGEKDEYVLKSETDKIFNRIASKEKKLVVYEDAGHGSLLRYDPIRWQRETSEFLGKK